MLDMMRKDEYIILRSIYMALQDNTGKVWTRRVRYRERGQLQEERSVTCVLNREWSLLCWQEYLNYDHPG